MLHLLQLFLSEQLCLKFQTFLPVTAAPPTVAAPTVAAPTTALAVAPIPAAPADVRVANKLPEATVPIIPCAVAAIEPATTPPDPKPTRLRAGHVKSHKNFNFIDKPDPPT